jgi:ABC-2 type transport system ATP-binding protein
MEYIMAEIILKIEHLTKRYGDKVAVDDLSLSIESGEIYGFIGHNGAGKTTTLKACAGILLPDAGEILIDGVSVISSPFEAKRHMAYLPDNPEPYPFLTGVQYLHFIADVYGVADDVRSARIAELGEKFQLTEALAQPISTYSHGMKQRLSLMSAWIHQPRLIMMDEPFVGLDPQATHLVKEMMAEHCASGGAIFFSTHVLDVAEKLCDKIAMIRNGVLLRAGKTQDVKGDASLESAFLDLTQEEDTSC